MMSVMLAATWDHTWSGGPEGSRHDRTTTLAHQRCRLLDREECPVGIQRQVLADVLLRDRIKHMMAVFIDPHMSGMTDDVIEGKVSETQFRRAVVWLVGSRLSGTLLAQVLLVPSALLITFVAKAI
ncbi:lipid II flippase family protein [Duganella callida]|uniref:lipid II flippase family protein n=1 Tax=Duganella callida TaxID=2561932 RepID=UPI001E606F48|nr:DUF2837 family protein [Duganella callida]